MIRSGAYGFLNRAYDCDIPLRKVVLLTPEPACETWAAYPHAEKEQPVEVKYSREEKAYLVFAGTRRVKDAIQRGDRYLPAFVEADAGEIGAAAIPRHLKSKGRP